MTKKITRKTTVLIADNDAKRKDIYIHTFNSDDNFTYHLINPNNPKTDLFKELNNKKPDIFIIFIHSLSHTEIDFLYKIKFENPKINIILITTPDNSKEIFKQFDPNIHNYLFTPFSGSDLKTTIEMAI